MGFIPMDTLKIRYELFWLNLCLITIQAILERNFWNPEVANVILKTSSNMEYILDNLSCRLYFFCSFCLFTQKAKI